jgi:hypothetical protein
MAHILLLHQECRTRKLYNPVYPTESIDLKWLLLRGLPQRRLKSTSNEIKLGSALVDQRKDSQYEIHSLIMCIELHLTFIIISAMRIAPLCQSICLIYCFFPIITHATASNSAAPPEVKTSDKGNSVDPSKTLMISEQYHFVPLGSFFQYSIASWE